MKSERNYIVIDQGGHATRAVVMDEGGAVIAWSERPVSTLRPRKGFVEHDPDDLLQTIRQSLEEAASGTGTRGRSIKAAGLAIQRSSVVCWDGRSGEALSPVISWQDTRARSRITGMAECAKEVHERTGLFLSAHYGASKLSWCLEKLPRARKALEESRLCYGPLSSFVVWRLTRERRCLADPVSASRTLLWNIHRGDWDPYLLEAFSLPAGALPVCVPTVHDFGHLDINGGQCPLRLVTGDQSAAMFAHGRLRLDTAYVNMGTGAFVSRAVGGKPLLCEGLLASVIHKQNSVAEYVLEGTVNGAGSALQWIKQTCQIEGLRKHLPGWLEENSDPPLFLNGISGLGSPYWIPDFRSEFMGESDIPGKVVAVVESIVFLLNRNLAEMSKHLKAPERIQVSGGLSSLDAICRLLADLTGIPVYRPVHREATARGTCYLLAGRPDQWEEQAPGDLFEPAEDPSLSCRYNRWQEEMEKRAGKYR